MYPLDWKRLRGADCICLVHTGSLSNLSGIQQALLIHGHWKDEWMAQICEICSFSDYFQGLTHCLLKPDVILLETMQEK